jgi:hypothetical protein
MPRREVSSAGGLRAQGLGVGELDRFLVWFRFSNDVPVAMRPQPPKILAMAFGVILLAVGVAYIALPVVFKVALEPKETTDVGEYRAILRQWSASGLVHQFPASIPAQARNVRFSASPGFLQGGAHVQLRLRLPADEIRDIETQLRPMAKAVLSGSTTLEQFDKELKDHPDHPSLPPTVFYTSETTRSFPAHYRLYVLQARNGGGKGFAWNHGDTAGTAVSSTAGEVVYWAERW